MRTVSRNRLLLGNCEGFPLSPHFGIAINAVVGIEGRIMRVRERDEQEHGDITRQENTLTYTAKSEKQD